jgi:hypothetical protein
MVEKIKGMKWFFKMYLYKIIELIYKREKSLTRQMLNGGFAFGKTWI